MLPGSSNFKSRFSSTKLRTAFSILQVVLLVLLVAAPAFIYFSEAGAGPGALHAPILISLAAGLIVGALAQWTRLCMVGGIRDLVLFREWKLLLGFIAILASALVCNLVLTAVKAGTFFTLGLAIGAAFAHNFGLASSAAGPTENGKIAVIIGIVVVAVIAVANTVRPKKA